MRLSTLCACAALLFLARADRLHAELYSVVRVTDLCGNASFQVCTEADCRKIQAELSEEAKVFAKVVETAKSEWNLSKSETFPSSRIKPRTFKVVSTAISREEADKLLAQARIKEERALVKEKEEADRAIKGPRVLLARGGRAALEERTEAIEERERDKVAREAEVVVRKKLSAAVGHEIPFCGKAAEAQQKKPGFFGKGKGK